LQLAELECTYSIYIVTDAVSKKVTITILVYPVIWSNITNDKRRLRAIHVRRKKKLFFPTTDLERPQTHISMSGHSLMLNICEMAKDTAIVSMEGG